MDTFVNTVAVTFRLSLLQVIRFSGRILSPPNRPPADILLQQQLTHRRPRFAAWSYHFNDNTQEWLELTIELPFAILLKQVAIYQHQSFLGSKPIFLFISDRISV